MLLEYKNTFTNYHVVGFETQKSIDCTLTKAGDFVNNILPLSYDDIQQVTNVKIRGDMNGNDFLALNKLVNIINLDLTEANIVAGGIYYNDLYNEDNLFKEKQIHALTALQTLKLPNTLKRIDAYAISSFHSLSSVSIQRSVTSIGEGAFQDCISLNSIAIPNSLTSISDYTFSGCTSLSYAEIGNSVASIGPYAFSNCSNLISVSIPSSVSSIGGGAFSGCKSLSYIYNFNPAPPSIEEDTFSNYNAILYVLNGSKTAYWLHPIWGKFYGIEEVAGVNGIEADDTPLHTDYYNLNGIKVATTATGEEPYGLSPGLYVTRCVRTINKVIIR